MDRGKQSIETLTLLFAYKVKYPKHVCLIRGNHEDERINCLHGFLDECTSLLVVGGDVEIYRSCASSGFTCEVERSSVRLLSGDGLTCGVPRVVLLVCM